MLELRIIEKVLLEQAEEIAAKATLHLVHRVEENKINMNSPLAQVVIGVRRSGKSTLCFNALHVAHVQYGYINFDDDRLAHAVVEDLDNILEVAYKVYGNFTHLFLDEVQNVQGWHLFANRLLRQGIRLIITGSNAKLLSGELATHLTGRHHVIRLYPFSFQDYCAYHKVETQHLTTKKTAVLRQAFDDYLKLGGFPELTLDVDSSDYINDLVNAIINRDIGQRFRLVNKANFEQLAQHIMNISPTQYTQKWGEPFQIKSVNTLKSYIGYLQQAFLLLGLHKYSSKSKLRLPGLKLYPVDVALMNMRTNAFSGDNLGWRLETMVYVELLRRAQQNKQDIYYLSERSGECDFVVCENNQVVQCVQVCYDLSALKTRKREISGLLIAANKTQCKNLLLLTDYEYADIMENGYAIQVRPFYRWATENYDNKRG